MPLIKSYITQNNGITTAVVEGVELNDKDSLLLDNGLEVEVDVIPVDPYTITDKQRRKIFALCNDIEQHTGQPREYMRSMFMTTWLLLRDTTVYPSQIVHVHRRIKLSKLFLIGCFTTIYHSITRRVTY